MNNFFRRLMQGRYGADALNHAMLVCSLALILPASLPHLEWLSLVDMAVLGLCCFRMLSKNIPARYRENQKFLLLSLPARKWFAGRKQRFHDRKTHRYFSCPTCGMTLRVPRGKGKICISCPKCRTQFVKKT